MAPFYGCASTVSSRIQSHYQETVHSLLLGPQEYLVLILSTWKERRLSQHGNHSLILTLLWEPLLGIQHLNHKATASTVDRKILGLYGWSSFETRPHFKTCSDLWIIFKKKDKKGKNTWKFGQTCKYFENILKKPSQKN